MSLEIVLNNKNKADEERKLIFIWAVMSCTDTGFSKSFLIKIAYSSYFKKAGPNVLAFWHIFFKKKKHLVSNIPWVPLDDFEVTTHLLGFLHGGSHFSFPFTLYTRSRFFVQYHKGLLA